MADKIKGFKAFGSDWKCNDFQFKVGDIFKTDDVKMCEKGFYFCENGIDVFSYYNPASSKFAEVEGSGKIEKHDDDSKVACSEIHCSEIHIKAEVSLNALIGAGVKFILDKVDWTKKKESNTGYHSAATNTGYRSAATNTGDQSAATNTGDQSAATNTGVEGCAISIGIEGMAKGAIGCWLTLAEWKESEYRWNRIDVKTMIVDGKKIKADTFYQLKKGKFIEVKS